MANNIRSLLATVLSLATWATMTAQTVNPTAIYTDTEGEVQELAAGDSYSAAP